MQIQPPRRIAGRQGIEPGCFQQHVRRLFRDFRVGTSHDSATPPTPSNEVCEGEEGFHRDPEDCGHFFNCISFDGELMALEGHCDEGLAFDLGLQTCNWENSVDCSAKVAVKSFSSCFTPGGGSEAA